MRLLKENRLITATTLILAALVLGGWALGLYVPSAQADSPNTIQIAIPTNVTINVGSHRVIFIGKPTSTSPVNCAPGTPNPQTVVVVEPEGGSASQITGVLAFHDHEIPNGTRYQIVGGPNACNTDFKLYTGFLE
jgi:hypothetical protein